MRMKIKPKFVFVFLSLLASAYVLPSGVVGQGIGDRNRPADGDGRYSIQGKIYLPNGKPAENAKIYISSADSPGSSTRSSIEGDFQVSGLRAGNYSISVQSDGFAAETERLTIDRFAPIGRTVSVVFHLRLQPQVSPGRAEVIAANPLLADVPKDAFSKFQKGMVRMAKNDVKGAIVDFTAAIDAYPKFAAAYYERGAAYLKADDPDKGLESFVKAISIKSDYFEAKYSVGYTHFVKQNYEVAAAVFNDVLTEKKDMPEAQMYLGISLWHLKNAAAAEVFLKRSISSGGEKVALAHRYLGGIYLQQKRNADAALELETYLKMVPSAPDASRLKDTIAELRKKS
ncbi:MAG TPA: tetratricopeptide repeat protein [Pyrinomonadaceae bacterium]|nr:tetratricopeptide repeat protein [Pyrinomonadaceae bacterium]